MGVETFGYKRLQTFGLKSFYSVFIDILTATGLCCFK